MLKSVTERVTGGVKPVSDEQSAATNRWLLVAIALGTTLAPLNSTMIAVALPRIQSDLQVSVSQTAWLVTIYLVAMAVGQPVGGRLGDLLGRRRMYLLGLIWFALASAACAFAPNLGALIFFRAQQGLAGALTFPNGAAMVREAVPPERRGSAFGFIGMTTGLAAAIGPPLGGVLVHNFGWEAIFWVNVPLISAAFLLNYLYLPRTRPRQQQRPPFDTLGTALFALSLGALILIPTTVRADRAILAIGALMLVIGFGIAFVRWELRSVFPVVDVRLFANQAFAAACASIALSNFVMYTTLLALPLYLDRVRGHNEQVVGITLTALSAIAAFWGLAGGRITDNRGRWLPAVLGAVALLLGISLLAGVVSGDRLWPIVAALAIMGLGIGIQGAPVQTAAVEAVSMANTGSAAGLYSTSRYIGSVVGTTILAIVFTSNPDSSDARTFSVLFFGIAIAALLGVLVNLRIAPREFRG